MRRFKTNVLKLDCSLRAKTGIRERAFPNISWLFMNSIFKNVLEFVRYSYLNCFLKPYQMDFASPFPIFKKKMRHAKKGINQIIKPLRQRGLTGIFCFHFAFLKDIPKWSTHLQKINNKKNWRNLTE